MFIYSLQQRSKKLRGQAIVEMALVVMVLLFLTLGLIQFAILANARISLTNLARDGGRYAAVNALVPPKPDGTTADEDIQNRVVTQAKATSLNSITRDNVLVEYPEGRTGGKEVRVTVTYNMQQKFILPVSFPGLAQWGNATKATASFVIE